MKKLISLCLSVLLLFSVFSGMQLTALAEDTPVTYSEGVFEYEITPSGNAKITKYKGTANELEIPASLGNYSVSVIGSDSFSRCNSLTSVIIPDSVISIDSSAFSGCSNLSNIEFSKNLLHIGMLAFSNCNSLTSIEIPESVLLIYLLAFSHCENLSNIILPDTAIEVFATAFDRTAYFNDKNNWRNHALYIGNHLIELEEVEPDTHYVVEEGTKTIGAAAFVRCKENLAEIVIPDSVIRIGTGAFAKNFNLKLSDIKLPDTDIQIGDLIIPWTLITPENETPITEDVYIGNHLIAVAAKNADNYVVREGTVTIADGAFGLCESIKSITLPSSIKRIGAAQGESVLGLAEYENLEISPEEYEEIRKELLILHLTDIYYSGTEEEWKKVVFTDDRTAYTNYSATTDDGKFIATNDEFFNATIHLKTDSAETSEEPQQKDTTKPQIKPAKQTVKLSLKKVTVKKNAKKLTLQATLKINGKATKGKTVTFKFNGKKYTAKTNKKGIAKVTIKKSVLKKLKKGKKITYSVKYGKKTVKRKAKVK